MADQLINHLVAAAATVERSIATHTDSLERGFNRMQNEFTYSSAVSGMPRFDGNPKNFRPWFRRLEKQRLLMGGDDEATIRVALSSADGVASDWLCRHYEELRRLGNRFDWDRFCQQIKIRFGEPENETSSLNKLMQLHRQNHESVTVFGERVRTHALEAFGHDHIDEAIAQRIATQAFMNGVRDEKVLKMLCRNRPATLDNAIQRASNEAGIQAQVDAFYINKRSNQPKPEPMDINMISEQLGDLTLAQGTFPQVDNQFRETHHPTITARSFPAYYPPTAPPPPAPTVQTVTYPPQPPLYHPPPTPCYAENDHCIPETYPPEGDDPAEVSEVGFQQDEDEMWVDETGNEVLIVQQTRGGHTGRGRGTSGTRGQGALRKIYRVPRAWGPPVTIPGEEDSGRGRGRGNRGTRGAAVGRGRGTTYGPSSVWQMRQVIRPPTNWGGEDAAGNTQTGTAPHLGHGTPLQFTADGRPICARCKKVGHIRKECLESN